MINHIGWCPAKKQVALFIFGIFVGFSFAVLFVTSSLSNLRFGISYSHTLDDAADPLRDVRINTSRHQEAHALDNQHHDAHALENSTVADQLFNEVKILCWIMTTPSNHQKKAKHVMKTWGARCNKLLFMSSAEDEEINAIPLPVEEGYDTLWAKTKAAFKYIYDNHFNDYDWFLKADDDTYVIVENLRFMLYPYAAETPIYFGCRFKFYLEQGFMSGGAGYVLSREAVRRFIEVAIPDKEKCRQENDGGEDFEIAKCLTNVQVVAGDSRDSLGRNRFFPVFPDKLLKPFRMNKDFWYWSYLYYETDDEERNGCSDTAISFHYVSPVNMYLLDYLIYLRPYGKFVHPQPLPHKLTSDNYGSVKSSADTSTQNKILS